ncbi:MAG: serine--tRNA ligase [Deltaproteobacteria bacterium]|nr:serine--tRNA ligase [Deltaproteobacteria bacterium]
MLDLRYLIDHFDEVRAKLARRGEEAAALLDSVREPSAERLRLIRDVEDRKHRLKNESKSLGKLPKGSEEFHTRRAELRLASEEIKGLENEGLARVEERIREILLLVPNLPDDSIPDGGDQDARVERVCGTLPTFDFAPKAHWDLGPELGIIDFERAARISGSRFAVMIGAGARLERALVQLMMDVHASRGYTEVIPPYLVGSEAMTGTGQLPKFAEDAFRVQGADLWLVPTAEVPVTNLHANEILEADDLPLRYAAFTPCFRSEAGAHGRDVRGLMRQHQFHKVELVKFTRPEQSDEALSDLVREAELILEKLELHYRVVTLAAGDMGFSASRCLDIEVWIPSLESFREISSCSNCRDFQARRARIRFRPEPKAKPKLVHTLNGSALAVGRAVIALLEQHQQADGTVRIPEALRPYMGTDVIKGVIKGV